MPGGAAAARSAPALRRRWALVRGAQAGARLRPLPRRPSSGNCRLQLPLLPQPCPRKAPEAGVRAEVSPAAMAVTAPESARPPASSPPTRSRADRAGRSSEAGDKGKRNRAGGHRTAGSRWWGCLLRRPPWGSALVSVRSVPWALCCSPAGQRDRSVLFACCFGDAVALAGVPAALHLGRLLRTLPVIVAFLEGHRWRVCV